MFEIYFDQLFVFEIECLKWIRDFFTLIFLWFAVSFFSNNIGTVLALGYSIIWVFMHSIINCDFITHFGLLCAYSYLFS